MKKKHQDPEKKYLEWKSNLSPEELMRDIDQRTAAIKRQIEEILG